MGLMILPAFVLNYLVVIFLEQVLNYRSFYILGPVTVGDIVGYALNVWVFRKYGYPKQRQVTNQKN
jgi:hypothetical protein